MAENAEESENVWWAAPRFIISAAAVLLLIMVGVIFLVWAGNDDEPDAVSTPPSPTTSATSTATVEASEESVCGLTASGGTTLATAPEDIEWEYLGGIAAPVSAEHGPGVVDEQTGVRSCYSHTPEGALLAVTGILAASGDPELLLETSRALVLDGPAKDRSVNRLEARASEKPTTTAPIEVAGFRMLSYSKSAATVEVVLAGDSGEGKVYNTTAGNVVWNDGDWYFELQADGSGGPVDGIISDLSGYILWGPNNG